MQHEKDTGVKKVILHEWSLFFASFSCKYLGASGSLLDSAPSGLPDSAFDSAPGGAPFDKNYLFSVLRNVRDSCEALCKVFIGRDIVAHFAVVELLICYEIEVAGSGKTE